MKFLFVSRKKYDTAINNNKVMNEQRKRVVDNNIELQKKIVELQEEIKKLKWRKDKSKEYFVLEEKYNNLLIKHDKVEKHLQYLLERLNEQSKKARKRKKQNYFKQCNKCGKIFKISSLNSNRMKCRKCIEKEKENRHNGTRKK